MVVHSSASDKHYPTLSLPVAYFSGPERAALANRYNGAATLANFTIQRAIETEPWLLTQIENGIRRGKLKLVAAFAGHEFGRLVVEMRVSDLGRAAGLNTVYRTLGTESTETWEAFWADVAGEFEPAEVRHATLRGAESYNFTNAPPELPTEPLPEQLASMGGVGLRAALAFQTYHDDIATLGPSIQTHVRVESLAQRVTG